jgi:tRNA (guanine37-N1)-methyltransferase
MKITVVTAFPDFLKSFLSTSIVGRGVAAERLVVEVLDLRDFADGAYRQVDDYAFGGGGMVLMAEPLAKALEKAAAADGGRPFVLGTSPQGAVLTQEMVESLAAQEHLFIVCGHYEGLDERFTRRFVDMEVSIGDYVLTGGELPAMVLIDAVARRIPGVVGKESAVEEDSFFRGFLDTPHFTRPSVWRGESVPEALLSGDHEVVRSWRRHQAVLRTLRRRPDVLSRANVQPYLPCGAYVALLHHPVLDRLGNVTTTAVTGLDLHDISRTCTTFGVRRFCVVTPLEGQREMVRTIVAHWTEGYGATFNPKRGEALRRIKVFPECRGMLRWIEKKERSAPLIVGTSARSRKGAVHWLELKRRIVEEARPVVFLFGTGWGLDESVLASCDAQLQPIRGGEGAYNHLSVRSAVSVLLDRFFGWR